MLIKLGPEIYSTLSKVKFCETFWKFFFIFFISLSRLQLKPEQEMKIILNILQWVIYLVISWNIIIILMVTWEPGSIFTSYISNSFFTSLTISIISKNSPSANATTLKSNNFKKLRNKYTRWYKLRYLHSIQKENVNKARWGISEFFYLFVSHSDFIQLREENLIRCSHFRCCIPGALTFLCKIFIVHGDKCALNK